MTRKELVNSILEKTALGGSGRLQVESVFENFAEVARKELTLGGEVSIPGLGKLKVRETLPRKVRNPITGKLMDVPASRKVVFVGFRSFKDALKGY